LASLDDRHTDFPFNFDRRTTTEAPGTAASYQIDAAASENFLEGSIHATGLPPARTVRRLPVDQDR
jgi:hypothetical protein